MSHERDVLLGNSKPSQLFIHYNILFINIPVISYQVVQKTHLSEAFKSASTREWSAIFKHTKPGFVFHGGFLRAHNETAKRVRIHLTECFLP